jgi:3-deoxy-7-phosphoheptulonate synthase
MHGNNNTIKLQSGYKDPSGGAGVEEVRSFFAIHRAEGTHAGGVHFEMTGQDVTERLGGAQGLKEIDLADRYQTALRSAPQRQPGAGIGSDRRRHPRRAA